MFEDFKIKKASDINFNDLESIVSEFFGKSDLEYFLNIHSSKEVSYKLNENSHYTKEYWLKEYEHGNIFVLKYNTRHPALTYTNDGYKITRSSSHFFNRSLEWLIQSLRPTTAPVSRVQIKKVVEEIYEPIVEKETKKEIVKEDDKFVGLIVRDDLQKIHLLTDKDIKKYKIQKRNPITRALQNQHPMIQGSGSIFAGLYGFGDWAARISGFRDWQLDNIDDIEEDMATDETKYILKLIKYIFFNENGSGELFLKSLKKYIKQNPEYVTSRFLTSTALGFAVQPKPTTTKVPVGFIGITTPALWGDITFSAKEIDEFAKSIILGEQ
mgnify:CR=1 FL=1